MLICLADVIVWRGCVLVLAESSPLLNTECLKASVFACVHDIVHISLYIYDLSFIIVLL